jgi:hypothetical protein
MIIQRNVQIIRDVLIQDIDTGYTYINVSRHTETNEDGELILITDYQFRVPLPVDFDAILNELQSDQDALLSLQADISNQVDGAGLRSNDIDNSLIKIAESSVITPVIDMGDSPRTAQSDEAVDKLIAKGTTIITVQP